MIDPSTLYLRKFSLIVGTSSTSGLELGDLRCTFGTHHATFETPNYADIRIYNLSEDTARKIAGEFKKVVMQAGYEGNFGLIFGGNIRQVRRGREKGTDTYVDILASDGDRAYNFAVVNQALAAGSTPGDHVKAALGSMSAEGVSTGYIPDLGGQALPRGKVLYGMARDTMRDVATSRGTDWSIQNGVAQMIPKGGYLPGNAIELTSESGLIGRPEQTNDGIKVRALLNPQFRVGGRIKLDNRSIIPFKTELRIGAFQKAPRLDDDGFYRIISIDFTGDTRGNDWYADLICVGIDASAPIGSKIIANNGGR